jgi:trk system potassium uptake protein TrkH
MATIARFVTPLRFAAVAANLALMLGLLGILLLVPLGVSFLAAEFRFSLIFGGLAAAAFGLSRWGRRAGRPSLEGHEALVVTALAYLVFSLFGAIAFLPETPFLDGFFEAMSGFTTTGLSLADVERLPRTLLFFRAYSQWIGGIGIVVLTLIILRVPGRAARKLYAQESVGERPMAGIRRTARLILSIYAILTLAGFATYALAGMAPFDALLNILATVSTGGFSPHARSLAYHGTPAVYAAVTGYMILGATGFPLYYFLIREGPRRVVRDPQFLILLGAGAAAALLIWISWQARARLIPASLLQSFAALTTTGFSAVDYARWPALAKALSIVLMMVGGSSFSTAGGLKIVRVIILFKVVRWTMAKKLLPRAATVPLASDGEAIADEDLKGVFGFFVLYLLALAASSFAFVLAGFGPLDSFFENASALGTVGLTSGLTSPGLSPGLKVLLILEMWAGRLEILPVLLVFHPALWLKRRNA